MTTGKNRSEQAAAASVTGSPDPADNSQTTERSSDALHMQDDRPDGLLPVPSVRQEEVATAANEPLRLAYLNVRQALIDSGYSEGNLHPVASAALESLEYLYGATRRHTSTPWDDPTGPPGMVGG